MNSFLSFVNCLAWARLSITQTGINPMVSNPMTMKLRKLTQLTCIGTPMACMSWGGGGRQRSASCGSEPQHLFQGLPGGIQAAEIAALPEPRVLKTSGLMLSEESSADVAPPGIHVPGTHAKAPVRGPK